MAGLKTTPNDGDVEAFLERVEDPARRAECREVLALMREVTGEEPRMWGDAIVGFGRYRYRYDSGREGEWFLTGFSPRKKELTLYILPGLDGFEGITSRLGRFRTGRSCLYLKRLEEVDGEVLRELLQAGVSAMGPRRVTAPGG
jgi:hypothetical protein